MRVNDLQTQYLWLLSSIVESESVEICIACGRLIPITRIWLAELSLKSDPRKSTKLPTSYSCPHCNYNGSHDYPLLIWRTEFSAPQFVFMGSAEYERRKPGQRCGRFGRLFNRLMSPFRDNLDLTIRQFAATLDTIRQNAKGVDHPAVEAVRNDFVPGVGIRMGMGSMIKPLVVPGLTADFALCAMKSQQLAKKISHLSKTDEKFKVALKGIDEVRFLLKADDDLDKAISEKDYSGTAAICLDVLGKDYVSEHQELLLTFALNLAWACALCPHARAMILPEKSLPVVENAVAFLAQKGDSERLAAALNNLGLMILHCDTGDLFLRFEKVISLYDRAISIYNSLGEAFLSKAGQVLLHRSACIRARPTFDHSENVESAIDSAKIALELFKRQNDLAGQAKAHNYLGTAYINRSVSVSLLNWYQANYHYGRAYEIWEKLGDERALTEETITLAATELELGRLTCDEVLIRKGFNTSKRAFERAENSHTSLLVNALSELLVGYGYMLSLEGASDTLVTEALSQCDKLETAIRQQKEDARLVKVSIYQATILTNWALSNPREEAIKNATAVVDYATNSCLKYGIPTLTVSVRLTMTIALIKASKLEEAEQLAKSIAHDTRMYATSAVSLSTHTRRSENVYTSHRILAYIQAAMGKPIEAINSLDKGLANILRHRGDTECSERVEAVTKYWSLLAQLESRKLDESLEGHTDIVEQLIQLRKTLDDDSSEHIAKSLSEAEIINTIPSGGAVVIPLFLHNELGLLVCVTKTVDGHIVASVIGCPELSETLVNQAASRMPGWPGKFDLILDDDGHNSNEFSAAFDEACSWIGNALFKPLFEHLRLQGLSYPPIVVISHGMLTYVPLHAATINVQGFIVPLCELGVISIAPSIYWLSRGVNFTHSENTQPCVLVISDSQDNLVGASLEGSLAVRSVNDGMAIHFQREEVTQAAVLSNLKQADFVHIAGHSEFRLDLPFRSSIKLADGELTIAHLIERIELAPRTIILSSCSSGQSAGLQGAGDNWNLPLVLHLWGVDTVISSMWPVDDIAMLLLYSEYYSLEDCYSHPARALMKAQTYLRRLDLKGASSRIKEICLDDLVMAAILNQSLHELALTNGTHAPFGNAIYWAATCISGRLH